MPERQPRDANENTTPSLPRVSSEVVASLFSEISTEQRQGTHETQLEIIKQITAENPDLLEAINTLQLEYINPTDGTRARGHMLLIYAAIRRQQAVDEFTRLTSDLDH